MRHPTSGEQLTFERREYRADPIEGPERHPGDIAVSVFCVIVAIGAIIYCVWERLGP